MTPDVILSYFQNIFSSDPKKLKLLNSSYDNVVLQNDKEIIRISLNKSREDVIDEALLINFLYDNGVKVPRVINTDTVTLPYADTSLPSLTTEFVAHTVSPILSDGVVEEAARQLHLIHSKGEEFLKTHSFSQTRHLSDLLEAFVLKLKQGMSSDAINREQVVADANWALAFLKQQANISAPHTILHNDYRPQNVLCNETGVATVIDFDYSISTTTPQKDVAHAALEWSFPDKADKPDMRIFKLFISSYAQRQNKSYDQYIEETKLYDWVKASAMLDAAGFYLHNPDNTRERFGSYMYKKYKFFQAQSNDI